MEWQPVNAVPLCQCTPIPLPLETWLFQWQSKTTQKTFISNPGYFRANAVPLRSQPNHHPPLATRLPFLCHSMATHLRLDCQWTANELTLDRHLTTTQLPLHCHLTTTQWKLICQWTATCLIAPRLPLDCHLTNI